MNYRNDFRAFLCLMGEGRCNAEGERKQKLPVAAFDELGSISWQGCIEIRRGKELENKIFNVTQEETNHHVVGRKY